MVRLETVEDFERIRQALNNPNSQMKDYCICPYDYCIFCKDVKEFSTPYGYGDESFVFVKCLGTCYGFFHNEKPLDRTEFFHFCNKMPPNEFWSELHRLNSREIQARFFISELEKRISVEKKKMRELKGSIERLARLRS